jgi:hypothetical protein
MHEQPTLDIGSRVTYADVNLRGEYGYIEALGRTKHGGDCLVRWNRVRDVASEECLRHLLPLK